MKGIVAQKGPFAVELEAGKTYYWCACGASKHQPFCDGVHDRGLDKFAAQSTRERAQR